MTKTRSSKSARGAPSPTIPSPEASAALRTALGTADTPAWRVAIIDALGYRKDAAAVPAIAQLTGNADPQVAATAIAELSAIGGADAMRDLQTAKGTATGPLRKNVIDALLLSADRMTRMGNAAPAAAIYQSLYIPSESRGVRIAALRGLVVSQGAKAIPTLTTVLSGDDDQMRVIASRLTGEVPGAATTTALAALVSKLPTAGQIALLNELGDRGDAAARPALLAAAKSTDSGVQLAALHALGQIGTAGDVGFLAQTASSTAGATADAARASLAQLSGKDVNPALVQDLNGQRAQNPRRTYSRHDEPPLQSGQPCLAARTERPGCGGARLDRQRAGRLRRCQGFARPGQPDGDQQR